MNSKKIGIFGGSFNPIHNGHLDAINHTLKKNLVDEIWIVPCKKHPFNKELETSKHRLAMLKLAISNNRFKKRIRISNIEIKSKGKNYTINTVKKLKNKHKKYKFYLIIGSDILKDIKKWYKFKELQKETKFIVFKRPKNSISSTQIRKGIKQGKSLKNLVPTKVKEYIKKKKLFK